MTTADHRRVRASLRDVDLEALGAEAREIDSLSDKEYEARLAEGEDVEVHIAPWARAWVWTRDGELVPLHHDTDVPGTDVFLDSGWLTAADWAAAQWTGPVSQ